jgi:hypothetical protein
MSIERQDGGGRQDPWDDLNNRSINRGRLHHDRGRRYDEREHIDQPRFSTISSSASICTAWTVRRTILDQPVLVDHSSDPNRPLGRSAPLCYDDQRERKLGLLQRQKQKDHPTSTFPTAHRVDSLSPWDVSIEIWILSLSTTKRRYPPTPPSFDMQHGLCRSISQWHTSTDTRENQVTTAKERPRGPSRNDRGVGKRIH